MGAPTDQFEPFVEAGGDGAVAVAWYDRRNDAANNLNINVYRALSRDGGAGFDPIGRVTDVSFGVPPILPNFDPGIAQCYMGEYIAIAADAKNFYYAWGDNRTTLVTTAFPDGRLDPDVRFDLETAPVVSLGSISGAKFEDLDGDGSDREGGEPGLGGWTIQLSGPVGGSDGHRGRRHVLLQRFSRLAPTRSPRYRNPRPGLRATRPATNTPSSWIRSPSTTQALTSATSARPSSEAASSWTTTATACKSPAKILSQDWGINLDGTDGLGNPVSLSTATDASGNYEFIVNPGTYTATEKLPPGWVQTAPQPVPPGSFVLTVASGDVREDLDFGNAELGSAAGRKWRDQNADGVQDPAEPGLAGWEIHLDGQTGKGAIVHRVTFTGANGAYLFAELAPGVYVVSEVLQPGWRQTFPAPPGVYDITIKSGNDLTGLDFGNQLPLVKDPRLANLWLCNIAGAPDL